MYSLLVLISYINEFEYICRIFLYRFLRERQPMQEVVFIMHWKKIQFSLPLRAYSPYETTFHFRGVFFNKIEKGHLTVLYLYNVLYLFQLRKIEHRLGEVHSSPLYLNETGNPNVRNYSSLMENQNLNEFPSGVSFIQ